MTVGGSVHCCSCDWFLDLKLSPWCSRRDQKIRFFTSFPSSSFSYRELKEKKKKKNQNFIILTEVEFGRKDFVLSLFLVLVSFFFLGSKSI